MTAIKVAEQLGIPYRSANISGGKVWTTMSPSDNMTFGERIEVQEQILDEYISLIRTTGSMEFVCDRTPIDILAYLLSNIDSTTSNIFDKRVENFISRCVQQTQQNFNSIVLIPPGIPFVGDISKNGKVYNSKAYQESLTNIIYGAFSRYFFKLELKKLVIVPDDILDLDKRIDFIVQSLTETNYVKSMTIKGPSTNP
jgi:hypothetical protein